MKIAIFDLDGTIIDTIADIHFALMETLSHYNFKTFDQTVTTHYVGDGIKILLQRAVGEAHYSLELEAYFRAVYQANIVNNSKIFDGMDTVLSIASEIMDHTVILSNKSFDLTNIIVEHFGLNHVFDNWYGGDSFTERKPSPIAVNTILKTFNISAENAIMIGDNHTDIEAGANAGVSTCFCEYGYGSVSDVPPAYSVTTALDLIPILEAFHGK